MVIKMKRNILQGYILFYSIIELICILNPITLPSHYIFSFGPGLLIVSYLSATSIQQMRYVDPDIKETAIALLWSMFYILPLFFGLASRFFQWCILISIITYICALFRLSYIYKKL
jgi:hypothetical protein